MISDSNVKEQTTISTSSISKLFDTNQSIEINNRLKNDFISYCYSFLQENDEERQYIQFIWNKYLEYVGDVAILSSFFDTLPYHIKTSVLPKYQIENIQWCQNLFHINLNALFYSNYYLETFQHVIRYTLKSNQYKQGIIYIPTNFDSHLTTDLTLSLTNIKFERISNDLAHEDMINISQLENFLERDLNNTQTYPLMVIANAGSSLLGHCDQLTKIKKICEQYHVWLHAIGDLLGSLALLSSKNKDNANISCDSLTINITKLFGIQNLPYLTFFLHLKTDKIQQTDDKQTSHTFDDVILHSPSIHFLSIWSISQRCSNDQILLHMKKSFDLTNLLLIGLNKIETIRILNVEDNQNFYTYERICSSNKLKNILPQAVVIFRFEVNNMSNVDNRDDFNNYIDLLNLWFYDKLSEQYSKMNLELLKSIHFKLLKSDDNNNLNQNQIYVLRFAPLEHLLDNIDQNDMQTFIEDIRNYNEILLATLNGRMQFPSIISTYENLISIPIQEWAGIGAIRYIPSTINQSEINEKAIHKINTIQTELARHLQSNDAAFSLANTTNENNSMFYLRLGMIRKFEDLDILLKKISNTGIKAEESLKYVEDMAVKIRTSIEKVQKDLQEENLQLIAQEGLLKQLPFVSNIMSWWSPTSSPSPLTIKGRSFDLNSGCIESTEETYANRMQIKKQSSDESIHNETDHALMNSDGVKNLNEENSKDKYQTKENSL